MDDFILTTPTSEHAEQIAEYRREFLLSGESMDGTGPLRRYENPYEYIEFCERCRQPETAPDNLLDATQFLFIRKSDGRLVGMIQVRHRFNGYLEKFGGHIGYCVRPGERRKGYAKAMLKAALPLCRELGLDKVLVTCTAGNIGSEKTILANGGIYESTVFEAGAKLELKRFWIQTL